MHLPLHGKGFRPASVSPAILGSQIHILTTIPTAAEKHWEWQPCLLPCCHCNTRDSSHSTGAALLRAWSSESSIPGQAALGLSCVWGHCCPEPSPRDKSRDSSQSTALRTHSHLPLWSLPGAKQTYFPSLFLQGKSIAICPVQMLENKKLRSRFQSYPISFLTFSTTHCERGFSFGH